MSKFEKVKKYYDSGFWNKKMVKNAVIKGWITEDEYEEIVGEPYAWAFRNQRENGRWRKQYHVAGGLECKK